MNYKDMAKAIMDEVPPDKRGPDVTITLSRVEWEMILAKTEGSFALTERGLLILGAAMNTIADTVAATTGQFYDEEKKEWVVAN